LSSSGQIDLDGLDHFSAAEHGAGGTADQQDLVDVVVENLAKLLKVVAAQVQADLLGSAKAGDASTYSRHAKNQCQAPFAALASRNIPTPA
jgi:hypothetical protein